MEISNLPNLVCYSRVEVVLSKEFPQLQQQVVSQAEKQTTGHTSHAPSNSTQASNKAGAPPASSWGGQQQKQTAGAWGHKSTAAAPFQNTFQAQANKQSGGFETPVLQQQLAQLTMLSQALHTASPRSLMQQMESQLTKPSGMAGAPSASAVVGDKMRITASQKPQPTPQKIEMPKATVLSQTMMRTKPLSFDRQASSPPAQADASLVVRLNHCGPTTGKYTTRPTIQELWQMPENQVTAVPNFRVQFGRSFIQFTQPVDLRSVDLDRFIFLSKDTAVVQCAPESSFNQPAIIGIQTQVVELQKVMEWAAQQGVELLSLEDGVLQFRSSGFV